MVRMTVKLLDNDGELLDTVLKSPKKKGYLFAYILIQSEWVYHPLCDDLWTWLKASCPHPSAIPVR